MDLSSLLKAEIAKKQQQLQKGIKEASAVANNSLAAVKAASTTACDNEKEETADDEDINHSLDNPIREVTAPENTLLDAERLRTRPERIARIRDEDEKMDTAIGASCIGDKNQEPHLAIKCNLYIHHLLRQWEDTGYKPELILETKKSLLPLLVKLRKRKLSSEFVTSLSTILYHIQQAQFSLATQSYMKLSIGNVAWPIGVTSVGIHARSAQERIQGKDKIANVMLDEPTRLWITSIKRLISFSELLERRKKSQC
ncbi:LANO_0F06502g1_1 [Lachancea nothofagi CBS 11611]|uniref:Pre-mRNA-splicing factor 18 n=1 Tax=Lachancea nothofagi CBS 11611 TaxID=1266666 RepID=A0A1G4K8I9_9SACH|nr:LANO_0F06502g1_1 [Lachancea nothofagi CBS 11611]